MVVLQGSESSRVDESAKQASLIGPSKSPSSSFNWLACSCGTLLLRVLSYSCLESET